MAEPTPKAAGQPRANGHGTTTPAPTPAGEVVGREVTHEVLETLGRGPEARRRRRIRRLAWTAGVVGALAAGGTALALIGRPTPVRYVTAPAERGTLRVEVSATGTVEPRNVVQVGAEINGRVESVAADFNDRVRRGQVLARLDTDQLAARLSQARAHLAAARAAVAQARATEAEATLARNRARDLLRDGSASRQQLDTATAAATRAAAAVRTANANVVVARAEVDAAGESLSKATIRSPIDGVVLSRQVEPGQTVIAALTAPVLFVLAEDLTSMELDVQVDEADVGKVRVGQKATFTVDAWPGRRFDAEVTDVHYAPTTVQGVVTYRTVLSVENPERLLRPGMTATTIIVTETRSNVLLVPSAALRFQPPGATETLSQRREQRVYLLDGELPKRVVVRAGPTDGTHTELVDSAVPAGAKVIVDVERPKREPRREE